MTFENRFHVGGIDVQPHDVAEVHAALRQYLPDVVEGAVDLAFHVADAQAMSVFIARGLAGEEEHALRACDLVAVDETEGFLPDPGVDDFAFHAGILRCY